MTDILNLPGLRVLDVHETESQYLITAESAEHQVHPCCLFHATHRRRNGTKRQVFRDLTTHGKFVEIAMDRQRFHCKHCGKTTYESVPHLNTDHRMTDRLVTAVGNSAIRETFTGVAQRMGLSEGTVRGVFRARVNQVLADRSIVTPRVLGLDEKHLLKGYRCVVGNIEQRTLIDILPTRFRADLFAYFEAMPDRQNIEVVCQDMYRDYRAVAQKFMPDAAVVVDKFHVVKMVNEALEKFRRTLNLTLSVTDRRKLKNQRKILLARYPTIADSTRLKLDGWLGAHPALDDMYWLKERFYDFYDSADAAEAVERLERWQSLIKPEYARFFADLNRAMRNWRGEILNYFSHPYTNAYVEGVNRTLDDIQRAGRGYSFDVIRAKALLGQGDQKLLSPAYVSAARRGIEVKGRQAPALANYGVDIDKLKDLETRFSGDVLLEPPAPKSTSRRDLLDQLLKL